MKCTKTAEYMLVKLVWFLGNWVVSKEMSFQEIKYHNHLVLGLCVKEHLQPDHTQLSETMLQLSVHYE